MLQVEMQASLLNLPPRAAVLAPAKTVKRFLRKSGYDSLQYMPVRTPLPRRFGALAADGLIGSFHQSWAHGIRPDRLAFRAMLSGVQASTRRITWLYQQLPAEQQGVPTVVHPNEQVLDDRPPTWEIPYERLCESRKLGPLLHQPTVEVLEAWGLKAMAAREAAENLPATQRLHGFDGIALDLHHLPARRAGKQLERNWVDTFTARLAATGALAGDSEVQVALRPDFGGASGDVRRAAEGKLAETRAGELLGIIKENLPADQTSLRVTVEVPAGAFTDAGGYREGNTAVCAAIRSVLGAT